MVLNLFPNVPSSHRIALIGEAPGKDEEEKGRPFIGTSGRFLAVRVGQAGCRLESCFLGNVSQQRPPKNDFKHFAWNGPEVQQGLHSLAADIARFNPNIVVLLGNVPLRAAKDVSFFGIKYRYSVANWRGSLFWCNDPTSPFFNRKCMATYHPAYVLRDYGVDPLFRFDLIRAVQESDSPTLVLPQRKLETNLTLLDTLERLRSIRSERKLVALDIEGGIDTMSCISFATAPDRAFIIPFFHKDGHRHWSEAEELLVWRELASTLEDPAVPKVLQNCLYDTFVLQYAYGIRVHGITDDIMLKHWELNSELAKGETSADRRKKGLNLGLQASIYTREPYYKGERKSQDDTQFYEYCCKDSAVTLEISQYLDGCLTAECSKAHYRQNMALLNPLRYMSLRGMLYDVQGAATRRAEIQRQLYAAQAKLNAMVGQCFTFTSMNEVFAKARATMGFKRAAIADFADLQVNCKKPYIEASQRLAALVKQAQPDLATIGEIEDLCEVSLNVQSPPACCDFLYNQLGLPVQWNDDKEDPKPTADYEALLKLAMHCKKEGKEAHHAIIDALIEIRALSTRQQMLSISADRDQRIRCGYNLVGSNTGRVTCYESPTGSGYNLQTIPKYTDPKLAPGGILGDRDLFIADPDHWFFQCDLAGADGWTVAAYSAMLGDTAMLNDYRAGLKPARNLALILRGQATEATSREDFRVLGRSVSGDDWDYFACKRVQHGASYLEGSVTISRNILKDSEGKLYLPPSECEKLRKAFFTRYPGIERWHRWVEAKLKQRPILVAASGQVRQFSGRPEEILTKAVAYEPQANTTWATNLAMYRLWTDPENRIPRLDNSGPNKRNGYIPCLRVEPLHQVHDALAGQFRQCDTAWAIGKIKSWFDNTLTIAGLPIVIPFDGGYGTSWGCLKEGTI